MDTFIHDIMSIILSLVGAAALATVTLAATKLKEWGDTKIRELRWSSADAMLRSMVLDAVDEVEQTMVRDLKASGSWTRECSVDAAAQALAIVVTQCAGLDLKKPLRLTQSQLLARIRGLIEATIARS